MRCLLLLGLLFSPPALAAEMSPIQKETCEKKRTCDQMRDCDEARFYYKQCGGDLLDRDGDGEPCEDLCGFKSGG